MKAYIVNFTFSRHGIARVGTRKAFTAASRSMWVWQRLVAGHSLSGAEYDPEHPIDTMITGVEKLSMFDTTFLRKQPLFVSTSRF